MHDLLKRIQSLELVARKNISSVFAGNYLTSIRGTGMVFYEARKYVYGESIRRIDWNITARMQEPYVKEVHDERQREVVIALDVSPSMFAGWQKQSKIEYAVEIAATLALSAIEVKDLLGWTCFSDQVHSHTGPAGGKGQLFRALRDFVSYRDSEPKPAAVSDPRTAIHRIQQARGRRFAVFIISDFIDRDVPDDLKYIQARHDVSLFHVYDPLEYAAAPGLKLLAASPEGDRQPTSWRGARTGDLQDAIGEIQAQANTLRIGLHSFNTREPVRHELMRFFHEKEKRI